VGKCTLWSFRVLCFFIGLINVVVFPWLIINGVDDREHILCIQPFEPQPYIDRISPETVFEHWRLNRTARLVNLLNAGLVGQGFNYFSVHFVPT
jgi:hypothetical protein